MNPGFGGTVQPVPMPQPAYQYFPNAATFGQDQTIQQQPNFFTAPYYVTQPVPAPLSAQQKTKREKKSDEKNFKNKVKQKYGKIRVNREYFTIRAGVLRLILIV
jgi:hypothetical protein